MTEIYNMESGNWSVGEPLQQNIVSASVSVLDDKDDGETKLVLASGRSSGDPQVNMTAEPAHWESGLLNMRTARGDLAAAVVGNIVYAMGGIDGNNALATVEAFDTTTHTWTSMPDRQNNHTDY